LGKHILENHKREEMLRNQNMLFFDFCARYFGEVIIKNYPHQEWKIAYSKKEYGYLRPYLSTSSMEAIGQIDCLFPDNPNILYEEALRFEIILKVNDELKAKSKYFGLDFCQYEYWLLIGDNSNFDLPMFIKKVENILKEANLEQIDKDYYFTLKKWILWLGFNDGESIKEESEEISLKMKDLEKREKVRNSKIRIDMIATKDKQMNHFNDHIFVLEAFETFKDVFIYNPRNGTFV
jgi:hypothetical protein